MHVAFQLALGLALAVATHALPHNARTPSTPDLSGQKWVTMLLPRASNWTLTPMQLEAKLAAVGVRNFWQQGSECAAIVPPAHWEAAQAVLQVEGVRFEVRVEDMAQMIAAEQTERARFPYTRPVNVSGAARDDFYRAWRNLDEIEDYIEYLRTIAPPQLIIEDITIGQTHEGRTITGISMRTQASVGLDLPKFMMNGCHHSGEWITAMGMTFFIEQMITQYGTDAATTRILDGFEWHLVPILNLDGFDFTWNAPGFRTWRKTRTAHAANLEAFAACELVDPGNCERCIGTDPNRNWPANFGGTGSSDDPCSNSYHGPAPFSEPMVLSMSRYMVENGPFEVYIDHHCCGEMYLQPYGYTVDLPPDHAVIDAAFSEAKRATDLLYGRNYRQGPTYTTIYPASGLGLDWAYLSAGVKWSAATEMRSSNGNGPAEPVLPGSQEVWEGMKALGLHVLDVDTAK